MRQDELNAVLKFLHSGMRLGVDVMLAEENGEARIVFWDRPDPQPSAEQLADVQEAALAHAARALDLKLTEDLLTERVRLHARASALGNAQEAAEIQAEITGEILPYLKELRDAPSLT